jgi:hypothetical protein
MRQPGQWRFSFQGYGECLPNNANYVELDKEKVDAWGIPVLKVHCAWGENELAIRKDMSIAAAEMLTAAGAHDIQPFTDDDPPGFSIHEMGTARMGRDPKTSVLNSYNQAHDVKNLFITDGGAMVSSSCVNPSLTYMALTARACDYAVQQEERRALTQHKIHTFRPHHGSGIPALWPGFPVPVTGQPDFTVNHSHTNPNAPTSGPGKALGLSPLVQARGADAARLKSVPVTSARASPEVSLAWRPAAARAADAGARGIAALVKVGVEYSCV